MQLNVRHLASIAAVLVLLPSAGGFPALDRAESALTEVDPAAAAVDALALADVLAAARPFDPAAFAGEPAEGLTVPTALPRGPLGSIDPAVLAAAGLRYESWMGDLEASLLAVPGFVALVPPALDGVAAITLVWSGSAAASPELPSGWQAKVLENAKPQPLRQELSKRSVRLHDSGQVPNLGAWNFKIGPGTQLLMDTNRDGFGDTLCTANYLWKDAAGNLYLGAAGHCFLNGNQDSGNNDWDVYACRSDCLLGGQSGALMQDLVIQQFVKLGPIAFARQQQGNADVGYDFGLVRIPSALRGATTGMVPIWDGPSGVDKAFRLGDFALVHGNAAYDGEAFATKSRLGVSLGNTATEFSMIIKSSGGDSGSAVGSLDPLHGQVAGVDVPLAGGILTHGIGVPEVGYGLGLSYGTTVPQAQLMAKGTLGCIVPVRTAQNPLTSPNAPATC